VPPFLVLLLFGKPPGGRRGRGDPANGYYHQATLIGCHPGKLRLPSL
jgi:hypothetical protein